MYKRIHAANSYCIEFLFSNPRTTNVNEKIYSLCCSVSTTCTHHSEQILKSGFLTSDASRFFILIFISKIYGANEHNHIHKYVYPTHKITTNLITVHWRCCFGRRVQQHVRKRWGDVDTRVNHWFWGLDSGTCGNRGSETNTRALSHDVLWLPCIWSRFWCRGKYCWLNKHNILHFVYLLSYMRNVRLFC